MEIQLTENKSKLTESEEIRDLSVTALQALKGEDIVVLDVRHYASFTDYMIFASGSSSRHVNAIASSVVEAAKAAELSIVGVEGEDIGEWVLVDLGDAIVHVMQPDVRQYYELEKLWGEEFSSS